MKILKLHGHKRNTGGVVNFQKSLESFNAQSEHVYLHFRTGRVQFSALLRNKYIRVFDQLFSYFWFPIYLLLHRPDIVEINSSLVPLAFRRDYIYSLLIKMVLPDSKLLLFNHGWDSEFWCELISGDGQEKLYKYFDRFDHFFVLTNAAKLEIESVNSNARVSIVTTGVDTLKYLGCRSTEAGADALTVLFLSRLEKEKGIGELLEVIPFVVDRYPTISFLIAGSGAYQERMKCHSSLDRCGNNIKFVGYLLGEDKLDAFRCADIYVFPSYSEGCPVSVLEALASGLPIIYTPVGALQEIMVSGENGLEVPVRSAKALAFGC